MADRSVGFVSHYDCARHDTGWNHPDHQGRLPAVMRAVYRDMLTLHDHLVEIEGRHATGDELRLVHTAEYLERLESWSRSSAELGRPIEVQTGLVVSDASWDAARAAVGSVLTAIDSVLGGRVTSAFCATRPPGAGAHADSAGGFGLLNSVAVGARYLLERRAGRPIVVLEWSGGGATSALPELLGTLPEVRFASFGAEPDVGAAGAAMRLPLAEESLQRVLASFEEDLPEFVLLAAGLDILADDPLGSLTLQPADVYRLTVLLREWADRVCEGRLVSALEGGYSPPGLGQAVVQHIRALAALSSAA
jgi:acetoin utilization deacetylase AcuC-like enzyme